VRAGLFVSSGKLCSRPMDYGLSHVSIPRFGFRRGVFACPVFSGLSTRLRNPSSRVTQKARVSLASRLLCRPFRAGHVVDVPVQGRCPWLYGSSPFGASSWSPPKGKAPPCRHRRRRGCSSCSPSQGSAWTPYRGRGRASCSWSPFRKGVAAEGRRGMFFSGIRACQSCGYGAPQSCEPRHAESAGKPRE